MYNVFNVVNLFAFSTGAEKTFFRSGVATQKTMPRHPLPVTKNSSSHIANIRNIYNAKALKLRHCFL